MKKCVFFTRALVLLAFGYLSTGAFAQCIHPFQWGSSAIPNVGLPVTNSGVSAGDYTVFTGTVSGETYTFSSSIASDWLTLTDVSNNVIMFGTSPLTWTATFDGDVRIHVSVNSGCTTHFFGRHITALCTTCPPPPPQPCIHPWQYGTSAIPNSGLPTTDYYVYAGQYSEFTGTVAGETYTFSSSNASDWLTLTDVFNNAILFGTSPLTWTATFSGDVYVHVSVNSGCHTEFIGRDITAQCTTCTPPPPGPCINPWQFGSNAIPNNGSPVTNFGVWAGGYTVFTGTVSGETYTFSSSNASDWLTLTDVFNNAILFGTSPLTWTATFSGDVYVHVSVNSGCHTEFIGRDITAQCTTCTPPPPLMPPGCATNFVVTPDPSCATYPVTISWDAVTDATGYLISLGITPGGDEIVSYMNVFNSLSYTFNNFFLVNTTYYYTVTPYNDDGNAVGCLEQQFTTGSVGCPCVPSYEIGKTESDLISQVTIPGTTLNNVSGTQPVNPAYTHFTGQPNYTANLVQGGTYNVTIAVGTWGDQHIRVWIDYNDDGILDPSESIGSTVVAPGQWNVGPFPPAVFTVNLANNAPLGTHRMRIRGVWSPLPNFHTTINPCITYVFGETEDYDITIVPPVNVTQLQAGSCGATNVAPNQLLFAVNVGAPEYRFRFNGPNNGGPGWNNNTFIVDRPYRYVYFNHLIPGFQFGATYSVDVAVGDGNGNFGPYGPACNVTLQSNVPLTQIQASQCGSTVNGNTLIFANQIFDAQGYRFRITGPNDGSWPGGVFILDRPVRYFYFNNLVPGATPGGTFTVEVAYLQNDGQTYSPYGPVCNVTLNAPLNAPIIENNDIFVDNKTMRVVEFGANASHNPFTTDFGIQVLNANDVETINVSIYDMSGKLIERNAVHPMDIENARFGAKLASGMYMIEVRQGANQAVIRQVKN